VSDIKLFKVAGTSVTELEGRSVGIEKTLQTMVERNLDAFLGVRFLASEYSTGKTHSGRIDTLGIDENNSPVIIEYKRAVSENVINQGLFYLDWLMDHRAEFTLLAMKMLGSEIEEKIEWSSPRLLCLASDFTRYDEHAVQQINRNIELLRYRWYEDGYLVLELINATTGTTQDASSGGAVPGKPKPDYKTVTAYLEQASDDLRALYDSLEQLLLGLGDDVSKRVLKYYLAFRRIRNFACVEVHPQAGKLLVFVKVDPDSITLEAGFSRDVRNIGHFGTGDLELTLSGPEDLSKAEPLLLASYEAS
jgi:predicted transport protein